MPVQELRRGGGVDVVCMSVGDQNHVDRLERPASREHQLEEVLRRGLLVELRVRAGRRERSDHALVASVVREATRSPVR